MTRSMVKMLAAVVSAVLWGGGAAARGEEVTYYVDPARSSLTLSGTWDGRNLVPGALSGLTISYTGTISADRDISANTLQLTGGSVLAQNGSGKSLVSRQPANYAFVPAPPEGQVEFGSQSFWILGLAFSVSSTQIASPGSFDASQLSVVIQSGALDYGFTGGGSSSGSVPISGNLTLAPSNATLLGAGGIETFRIPIDTDFTVVLFAQSSNPALLPLHLSGELVAVTPEPGSLALLVLPAMLLMRRAGVGI